MLNLETDIQVLDELDRLRIRSAQLRDAGRRALQQYPRLEWIKADDAVERALVCRALCYSDREGAELPDGLVERLEGLSVKDIFGSAGDEVPVLRAARSMQALVSAPDSAFSRSTFFCHYRIIRELYSLTPPDWVLGAAGSGSGGPVNAFITGECSRAVLGFARNLGRTATFLRHIRKLNERELQLEDYVFLEKWTELERQRNQLSFFVTIRKFGGNLSLKFEPSPRGMDFTMFPRFLSEIEGDLKRAVGVAVEAIEDAKSQILELRSEEEEAVRSGKVTRRDFVASEEGHRVALTAVRRALVSGKRLRNILQISTDNQEWLKKLEQVENELMSGREAIISLLSHTTRYFEAVIDRELTAAAARSRSHWDPAELAMATASFGALTQRWDDERVSRAADLLSEALSARGRIPHGRPFFTNEKGYALNVIGAEVMRSFSQVLQHRKGVNLDPSLARAMLALFEDTKVNISGEDLIGWAPEVTARFDAPFLWATAVAVLALDRINRMLDKQINEMVFRHFTVRNIRPTNIDDVIEEPAGLTLDKLFIPDYGLALAPEGLRREMSVGIILERLRAHVLGVGNPSKEWDSICSVVLHGPPGTGKTTFAEALALTSGAPLVEVTPSDIMVGGEEALERRTRAVFKALALLTGSVVMFDEFEPVLWARKAGDSRTLYTFLTPGMLPKLKALNRSAKARRVAYLLATNLVGSLDGAAIRAGRFDERIAIFAADPLSRVGRLVTELVSFAWSSEETLDEISIAEADLVNVIAATGGVSMERLCAKGWFVRPSDRDGLRAGTPFGLILGQLDPPQEMPAESILKTHTGNNNDVADLEWRQFQWLRRWEEKVKSAPSLAAILHPAEEGEVGEAS